MVCDEVGEVRGDLDVVAVVSLLLAAAGRLCWL